MAQLFTTAEIAESFNTDAKTLRRFLRADARDRGLQIPGKGSKWAISKEGGSLARRYRGWAKAEAEAKAARAQKAAEALAAEAEDENAEDADLIEDDATEADES